MVVRVFILLFLLSARSFILDFPFTNFVVFPYCNANCFHIHMITEKVILWTLFMNLSRRRCVDGRSEPQLCGVGSLRQPSGSSGGEVSRPVSQQRSTNLPVCPPDHHPLIHEDQDPEGTDNPERTTIHYFFFFSKSSENSDRILDLVFVVAVKQKQRTVICEDDVLSSDVSLSLLRSWRTHLCRKWRGTRTVWSRVSDSWCPVWSLIWWELTHSP